MTSRNSNYITMKTYQIQRNTLAALCLVMASCAGHTKNSPAALTKAKANHTQDIAMEFDQKTSNSKPAGPKPVVPNYPPAPEDRIPWTAKRLAMQPLRFIVMVAKAPLILPAIGADAVGTQFARAYGGSGEFADYGKAFRDFDPGPAIDADLGLR